MKPALAGVALAALCALSLAAAPVRAEDLTYDNTNFSNGSDTNSGGTNSGTADAAYPPYQAGTPLVVSGLIRQVDSHRDRLVVVGDNGRRYNVDDYNAEVRLRGAGRVGEAIDLTQGMRVLVTGTLLGRTLLEADQVRVLPPAADEAAPAAQTVALAPILPLTPLDRLAPLAPVFSVPAAPAIDGKNVALDAVITGVDAAAGRVSLLGPDDKRLTADAHGTDIILRDADRDGQLPDLARGMRVHLIGTQGADGLIQADRIRELPAAPAASPAVDAAPDPAPAATGDLSQYTGVLIDARGLPTIERSPAPTIVGPDAGLLYPDRAHVPTPDEVQDESIVRYYRTLEDAEAGVAGAHPLVLTGVAVVGELDGVQLSAADAALFGALDKRLRYSRTWKVGFLIPANR